MWHSMWGWDGSWGWFGLMHLVWWVVAIAGAVVVFRFFAGRPGGNVSAGDHAFEILRERFARGEIDQGEFDQRAQHLREDMGLRK